MDEIEPADLARSLANVPLFREIRRLIEAQKGPVNWEIAAQVAGGVADAGTSYAADSLDASGLEEACRVAEMHAASVTGFESSSEVVRIELVDRAQWARRNLEAFRPLIERLSSHLGSQVLIEGAGPFSMLANAVGPILFGIQFGFLIGHLSQRVLGQYDICFPRGSGGSLAFVFPNIVALERDLEVDPAQFRLWTAGHEVVHRLEFESVHWTAPHVTSLVERYIDAAEIDQSELAHRLQSLGDTEELARIASRPDELLPLVTTSAQQAIADQIQAFMSLLEGYAEWTVSQFGRGLLPEGEKIKEAMTRRRAERSSADRLLQVLLGLDLRGDQHRAGEKFVTTVEEARKRDLLWQGPDFLPTMEEIFDPPRWLSRVAFG